MHMHWSRIIRPGMHGLLLVQRQCASAQSQRVAPSQVVLLCDKKDDSRVTCRHTFSTLVQGPLTFSSLLSLRLIINYCSHIPLPSIHYLPIHFSLLPPLPPLLLFRSPSQPSPNSWLPGRFLTPPSPLLQRRPSCLCCQLASCLRVRCQRCRSQLCGGMARRGLR